MHLSMEGLEYALCNNLFACLARNCLHYALRVFFCTSTGGPSYAMDGWFCDKDGTVVKCG